jgi:hypothetical protein
MSWSKDSVDHSVLENRLVKIPLDAAGEPLPPTMSLTGTTSDEACESTLHWPSGLSLITLGGATRLALGHDEGIAVFDPETMAEVGGLDLRAFGRLFTQLSPVPDGQRLFALAQCKALSAFSDFVLPYGAGTETADKFLVAVLEEAGGALAVASPGLDVDGNGSDDRGVDLDFWHVKAYLRSYDTTLPIPPVVFTGPSSRWAARCSSCAARASRATARTRSRPRGWGRRRTWPSTIWPPAAAWSSTATSRSGTA